MPDPSVRPPFQTTLACRSSAIGAFLLSGAGKRIATRSSSVLDSDLRAPSPWPEGVQPGRQEQDGLEGQLAEEVRHEGPVQRRIGQDVPGGQDADVRERPEQLDAEVGLAEGVDESVA